MSKFRVGSVGHSLMRGEWSIIFQSDNPPVGISRWEAWNTITGEIVGRDTLSDLVSVVDSLR